MKFIQQFSNKNLKRRFLQAIGTHAANGLRIWKKPPTQHQEQEGEYHYDVNVQFDEGYIYEMWQFNGQLHRSHGPAYVQYDADTYEPISKSFHHFGKLHRLNGPAVLNDFADHSLQEYYVNGSLHRENGPAVIEVNKKTGKTTKEEYYLNGRLHREDGPARRILNANKDEIIEAYFRNGVELSNKQLDVAKLEKR